MFFFIKTIPIAVLALFYCPNAWSSQAAIVLSLRQSILTQSIAQTPAPTQPSPIVVPLPEEPMSGRLDLPPLGRPLGGRGDSGICIVSPGLLEQENVIWSDRPLFLWQIMFEAMAMQRLEVFDQDGKILWDKRLAATDKSAAYEGQALQPGQYYQWRLTWTVQGTANSATHTFQVMDSERRNSVTSQIQARTRQLQASGASEEEIAIQQANDLLNRSEPLVSDALQILYAVETPTSRTTQQIQAWIDSACSAAKPK